jgi:hypothetical protein
MASVQLSYPSRVSTAFWNVIATSVKKVKKRSAFEPRYILVCYSNKLDINQVQDLANALNSIYKDYTVDGVIGGPSKADDRSLFYPYFTLHLKKLDYASSISSDIEKIISAGEIIAGKTVSGRDQDVNDENNNKNENNNENTLSKKYIIFGIIGLIVVIILIYLLKRK